MKSPYSNEYSGWLGVDSIICETDNNKLLFHPCLEINCRHTMGAVVLALRDRLAEGSGGIFQIMYGKENQYSKFCEEMVNSRPLTKYNGKIIKGFIPLTEPADDSLFGAYMLVSEQKM